MPPHEPHWRRYLRFLGPDVNADVDDELRFHLESLEADLRAQGLSDAAARREAARRFGNLDAMREALLRQDTRHSHRAARSSWWRDVAQDSRHSLRSLAQHRAFTIAIVIVLALGVGATTAMFSAVDAALLRPLPFTHPERLVVLRDVEIPSGPDFRENGMPAPPVHLPDITEAAKLRDQFSHVAAYAAGGLNLSDPANPQRVRVGVVTQGFFATLGAAPEQGRTFSPAEGAPNGPAAVILSHRLWQRQYGGQSMLGAIIQLNGRPYSVVGIMPPGFSFPQESELWIPLSVPLSFQTFEPFRGYLPSTVIGRLADEATPASASARLFALWTRAFAPEAGTRWWRQDTERLNTLRARGVLAPLRTTLVGDRARALLVLLGATGLLLLIACANVTNLLLSRAASRRREIALRAVLGATRSRLVRQLLTESVMLAAAGTALGVALAPLALHVVRVLMPARLAGLAPAQLDLRVLGFAAALALLTGVGFGLWPALAAARANARAALSAGGGHGATAGAAARARRALVTAELALTLVLLVGSGLMLRSFLRLTSTSAGLQTDHVGTLEFAFPQVAHARATRLRTIAAMIDRMGRIPGVSAVGAVNDLPLAKEGGTGLQVTVDGAPPPPPDEPRFARYLMTSGGYFRAMGIPLLSGRVFTAADDSLSPRVVIINAAMARRFWPGQSALGRTMHFAGDTAPVTVIGIVGDVRETSLDEVADPQMFFSIHDQTPDHVALVARGALDDRALLARMTEAVHSVDRTQAVFNVRTMDEVLGTAVAPRRTNTVLIALFGALALLLAALGVYAVVSYGVTQRRRELGIRAALGATGADLVTLVAREMTWVVMLGVIIGLMVAWLFSRLIASQLYDVAAHDPAIFALAAVALIVPAAAATLVPALRATQVDPAMVMKAE